MSRPSISQSVGQSGEQLCHSIRFCFGLQLVKQRAKEEMDRKLLEQRAVFIEKAKTINIDSISEERSRKSGGKVSMLF